MTSLYRTFLKVLASNYFFIFILVIFIAQASWLAFSFRFSMIYDEYYHFGLIEHFSHQFSPWISNQPLALDIYGGLDRQPHLLYHYLLSFPFRLVNLVTDNFAVQVIAMRIVNIGLFAGGLLLFWRLFKEMGISPVFRNLTLLFFVLLPVTPFVAATVNYDNLVFPLTALILLLAVRIIKEPKAHWHHVVLLVVVGMIGALSKSAFLPIFTGSVIGIAIVLGRRPNSLANLISSFRKHSLIPKLLILSLSIVVTLLFVERFAVNIISYGSISPSCSSQIGEDRCLNNYVESRAQNLKNIEGKTPVQPPRYITEWNIRMVEGLLLTGANTEGRFGTKMGAPMPIPYLITFLGAIMSLLAIVYAFDKKLKILPGYWLILGVTALYLSALFYVNYKAYYTYYEPIAIQGRYLLPVLPLILASALIGLNYLMRSIRYLKPILLLAVLLLFMNGAGLLTHLMRSDESWNWDNTKVREINNSARNLLQPLVKEWWYER